MEVSVRGWGRDFGKKNVRTTDLTKGNVIPKLQTDFRYDDGKATVTIEDDDSICIGHKWYANLNGNYLHEIKLTREDILMLFNIAFGLEETNKRILQNRRRRSSDV